MNCRIGGLHCVAKSRSVKKAMVLSFFFCGCMWLLRYISYSSSWTNHIETNRDGENGYVYMGRKELGAWPRDKGLSQSQHGGHGSKENEGMWDDDSHHASLHDENGYFLVKENEEMWNDYLYGNQANKDQDASLHDENGHDLGNLRFVFEVKDAENELQMLRSKSNDKSSGENSDVEGESHRNNTKLFAVATWKDQGKIIGKAKLGRLTIENVEGCRDCEEHNTVQETKMLSNSNFDLNETVQEFQAFHDETGRQDFSRWQ